MNSFKLFLVVAMIVMIPSKTFGKTDYLYVGKSVAGTKIYVINGVPVADTVILDKLVLLSKELRAGKKEEFWFVVSSDVQIKDFFSIRGLLGKAGSFNEKCFFYEPATKKVIRINLGGPAEYVEWLAIDIEYLQKK